MNSLAEARDRTGVWGPATDLPLLDTFEATVARRKRLERLFPGFTIEQILDGLIRPVLLEAGK